MIYAFDDFELDTGLYELRHQGTRCPLEPQVFDVLACLVEHHDRVVTKSELIDRVWPERFISEAALTSRLMAARKALGDDGRSQRFIKTVHGRGYHFAAPVRAVGGDGSATPQPIASRPSRDGQLSQEIRFCTSSDGVRVAFATSGEGPPLVKAANWISHLEYDWRSPIWRHWMRELSRDHTLVRYDERGSGLSDLNVEEYSVEAWVRDLEAVVDTLGLERFPLIGISQGGPVAVTYAVRHPERVTALILYGTYALGRRRRARSQAEIDEVDAMITLTRAGWERDNPAYRQIFANNFIPGATPEQMRWFGDLCRVSTSAENAVRFREAFGEIDISGMLPHVSVPTLVLHTSDDENVPVENGRALAARIPGARFVPLEGRNHLLLEDEPAWPAFLTEVRRFLGVPHEFSSQPPFSMSAILFTDVEGSTALTRELGDRTARDLLRQHARTITTLVSMHGGTEVKQLGDGAMAAFKSAVRAVECAVAIQRATAEQEAVRRLRVRIGIHAGDAIEEAGDLHGLAVITASRITEAAQGGEIVVSGVVAQLTAGTGFELSAAREIPLKGFDAPVRVHSVTWRDPATSDI